MGSWNYDIYGNDMAMDLLLDIKELIELEDKCPFEIISEMLRRKEGVEELLVLADFELFACGELRKTSKVLEVINDLIEEGCSDWDDPQKRIEELLKFKNKIIPSKYIIRVDRTQEELLDWIDERRKCDIMIKIHEYVSEDRGKFLNKK